MLISDPADGRPSLSAPSGMDEHCHGHHHDDKHSHGDHHAEHTHEDKLAHSDSHGRDHKHDHTRHSNGQNHNQGKSVDGEVIRGEDERMKDLNRVGQKILAEIQANFGEVSFL